MGLLEILLLLAGIVICVISFRIPAKQEEQLEETKELAKEEIKGLVEQELSHVREKVEGTVDETITYAVEKTERFMDRMSNEKIMAINEYSDTVMEELHKTHTEVLFLYDMLNDKQENLKSAAAEVDKVVKAAKETGTENAASDVNEVPGGTDLMSEAANSKAMELKTAEPKAAESKTMETKMAEPVSGEQELPEVEISFAGMGMENSNEEILRLHKEGKSNVVIAKELGLGVGEVKLVIDLFEGM